MKTRYSGKSFKDSSTMKKAKLSPKEKRKIKREQCGQRAEPIAANMAKKFTC